MTNPKLQQCYEAFERLKAGEAKHKDFKNLPLSEITFSKISQEAGHDAGYLKKSREQHKALLSMLTLFLDGLPKDSTIGKGAAIQREKNKANNARAAKNAAKTELEASLGRELQLYHRLKEVEEEVIKLKKELAKYSNVTQLPL